MPRVTGQMRYHLQINQQYNRMHWTKVTMSSITIQKAWHRIQKQRISNSRSYWTPATASKTLRPTHKPIQLTKRAIQHDLHSLQCILPSNFTSHPSFDCGLTTERIASILGRCNIGDHGGHGGDGSTNLIFVYRAVGDRITSDDLSLSIIYILCLKFRVWIRIGISLLI